MNYLVITKERHDKMTVINRLESFKICDFVFIKIGVDDYDVMKNLYNEHRYVNFTWSMCESLMEAYYAR